VDEVGETGAPRLILLRQEADEAEIVARQARCGERGECGRSAGDRDDADAFVARRGDEAVARIGDQRGAGVGNERDGLAGLQRRDQLRAGGIGIVLMIGDGFRLDRIAVEQAAGDAGILAGEDIAGGQRFERADGDVAEIADRRGDDIEARLQRRGGDFMAADNEARSPLIPPAPLRGH
jgi:hypothetical protein